MAYKILIVDDEDSILAVLSQLLSPHCEVLTARNGETALALLKSEKPVFVFLDIKMPGMSGVEVLAGIMRAGMPPLVWMLTGDDDLEMAELTLRSGASGYITKPFDADRLRTVLLNALADLEAKGKETGEPADRPWHVKKDDKKDKK